MLPTQQQRRKNYAQAHGALDSGDDRGAGRGGGGLAPALPARPAAPVGGVDLVIRETLPDCGGQSSERAVTMYRMWACFDCGLEFTMKTRERPEVCPRCLRLYDAPPEDVG